MATFKLNPFTGNFDIVGVTTVSGVLTTLLELTDTPAAYDNNKYLRSTVDGTEWATVSGGEGTDHSELANLAYADSGHTGFSPDTHLHDDRYYTESEVNTISGSLNYDIECVTNIANYADSPMIVTGGEVTRGTNAGTFKVAALTALIRKTDSTIGELAYVTKTEEDNIAITLADTLYYVVLNYNDGLPTIGIITALQNFNDNIPIGSVMKDTDDIVHYISGCFRLQNGVANLHYRAFEIRQLELTSGNTIAYSGTDNFTMTAGVVYEGINRLTQDAYNSAIDTFQYIYSDGAGSWTTVSGNAIDYGHYDDGDGTLGSVGVAKTSCHWVYRHVDDGDVYVLYGTDSYTTAEAEVAQIPTGPNHLTQFGCLIGKIIAPYAGGSFIKVQMVTDVVFTGTSVATHNDLGGLNDGDYKHLTAAEKALSDTAAQSGANADITSITALTQITRATGGTFDIAIGNASGDDFTVDTNKLVVEGDTGNVGIGATTPTAILDVNSDILRLRTSKTPATSSGTGNQGDICWDEDFMYVCTATNTWTRAALTTW